MKINSHTWQDTPPLKGIRQEKKRPLQEIMKFLTSLWVIEPPTSFPFLLPIVHIKWNRFTMSQSGKKI